MLSITLRSLYFIMKTKSFKINKQAVYIISINKYLLIGDS